MLPQSLSSRPFVISSEQSVNLELFEGPNESAKICVDGQDDIDIPFGERIEISKMEKTLKLVHPNINSLNLGIMIVSIMNLVIHCQELENIKWNKYFVSPQTHLYHHQSKNKLSTYSAPTFNLEYIFRNQTKIL